MIVLRNLTKVYRHGGRRKVVADNINLTIPSGVTVGLLGRNGAGKSTLIRMIAGLTAPTSGEILTDGQISFPVGISGAIHPDMTGSQNTRFVARIYGVDTDELVRFVEDFAELGDHFHMPVRTYSSGMRGRLGFGINLGIQFDTYLIDEVTATGDADFVEKSRRLFKTRTERAGAIFVSHSVSQVRKMCEAGAVLANGKLIYYPNVEDAIAAYETRAHG